MAADPRRSPGDDGARPFPLPARHGGDGVRGPSRGGADGAREAPEHAAEGGLRRNEALHQDGRARRPHLHLLRGGPRAGLRERPLLQVDPIRAGVQRRRGLLHDGAKPRESIVLDVPGFYTYSQCHRYVFAMENGTGFPLYITH